MPSGATEMAVKLMASFNQIKHFGSMFAVWRMKKEEGMWMWLVGLQTGR